MEPNFELAYQVRVAMEKIRFAIRTNEQDPQGAEMQLADALTRLQHAERKFQEQTR